MKRRRYSASQRIVAVVLCILVLILKELPCIEVLPSSIRTRQMMGPYKRTQIAIIEAYCGAAKGERERKHSCIAALSYCNFIYNFELNWTELHFNTENAYARRIRGGAFRGRPFKNVNTYTHTLRIIAWNLWVQFLFYKNTKRL